ncbi:MAG: hypothetical protein HZB56_04675 [Deltaproteobacteria bacterium]|nr:hypothetical protein [Deltaproteobacteria bacterium]
MPLFGRPDGTLVSDLPRVRQVMPYLMAGRNESAVLHEALYDLSRTGPWLAAYNRSHAEPATLFHLLVYAFARALHERPGLNRFVSGGRIYQRGAVTVSFAAKYAFEDHAPFVTVKLAIPFADDLPTLVGRVRRAVEGARSGRRGRVDMELRLLLALPGFGIRGVMALLRRLDAWNLLPRSFLEPDPMYTSLFVANLGSVGIDNAYHHLYEYGTCSLFAAVGRAGPRVFAGAAGAEVRQGLRLGFTFDERIADGHYCTAALAIAQRVVEDPQGHLGPAEQVGAVSSRAGP